MVLLKAWVGGGVGAVLAVTVGAEVGATVCLMVVTMASGACPTTASAAAANWASKPAWFTRVALLASSGWVCPACVCVCECVYVCRALRQLGLIGPGEMASAVGSRDVVRMRRRAGTAWEHTICCRVSPVLSDSVAVGGHERFLRRHIQRCGEADRGRDQERGLAEKRGGGGGRHRGRGGG